MPDYQFVLWDSSRFDTSLIPYVAQACHYKKWAFASDYIRAYALYTYGGVYLDTDVVLLKNLDFFLNNSFFSAIEYHPSQVLQDDGYHKISADGRRLSVDYVKGIQIQAAIMGSEKNSPFLKDVMSWYENNNFLRPDNSLSTDIVAPYIYSRIAEKYGFRYADCEQSLNNDMHIYPSTFFAGNKHELTPNSFAIHLCFNSWRKRWYNRLLKLIVS